MKHINEIYIVFMILAHLPNLQSADFRKECKSSDDPNLYNNIVGKAYYTYILDKLLSLIDPFVVLGPHQYCLTKSIQNTSGIGESNNTVPLWTFIDQNQPAGDDLINAPHATYNFQFSNTNDAGQSSALGHNLPYIDYYPAGSSSTQTPYKYTNVNPPPGSPAGGNINLPNQGALQSPAMYPSTNETAYIPYMFLATPDRDGCYAPINIQSPDRVVIPSDEDS